MWVFLVVEVIAGGKWVSLRDADHRALSQMNRQAERRIRVLSVECDDEVSVCGDLDERLEDTFLQRHVLEILPRLDRSTALAVADASAGHYASAPFDERVVLIALGAHRSKTDAIDIVIAFLSEAGLTVQQVYGAREVTMKNAFILKHLDEVVTFLRLLVHVFIENFLVDSISGLWILEELLQDVVILNPIVFRAGRLHRLKDIEVVKLFLARHPLARNDDDLLESASLHAVVELLLVKILH